MQAQYFCQSHRGHCRGANFDMFPRCFRFRETRVVGTVIEPDIVNNVRFEFLFSFLGSQAIAWKHAVCCNATHVFWLKPPLCMCGRPLNIQWRSLFLKFLPGTQAICKPMAQHFLDIVGTLDFIFSESQSRPPLVHTSVWRAGHETSRIGHELDSSKLEHGPSCALRGHRPSAFSYARKRPNCHCCPTGHGDLRGAGRACLQLVSNYSYWNSLACSMSKNCGVGNFAAPQCE